MQQKNCGSCNPLGDYGPEPYIADLRQATMRNQNYRTALWTGQYQQLTLMKINVGDDIGLEVHPHTDQFIYVVEGHGCATLGSSKDKLNYQRNIGNDCAVFVPAGTWHNVINTGRTPLKVFTLYAPPHHPHGTVHQTKAIAEADEQDSQY